jgi:YHS domain-containing protein
MLRFVLLLLLFMFVARAFWRVIDGVIEGVTGEARGRRTPQRRVQMMRDPVCGTFVVPDRALTLTDGSERVYFCSTRCRDEYRARTA